MKLIKRLGQHLLADENIAEAIVEALDLSPADTVLEIGPGAGALTQKLVKKSRQVLAVEKDFKMIDRLKKHFKSVKNLKIIHQDILRFDETAIDGPYKLIGNLPYNITSPIIRKFLGSPHKPSVMVLTVQKEVAQRITAPPGRSERGILTLMVEYFSDAKLLFQVPATTFIPVPKVDSAVVKIVPKSEIEMPNAKLFFQLVKAGFSAKRRQIHNSLAGGLALDSQTVHSIIKEANIDPIMRAEDLSLEDWFKLARASFDAWQKKL